MMRKPETGYFRCAKPEDAEAISKLVNQAFRPRAGIAGWTHEAHLIAGDRIDPAQVQRAMASDVAVLWLGIADDEVVACVQVEHAGASARIGMLAVAPGRQGGGLGKAMLAHAEAHAVKRWKVEKFVVNVLPARAELLAFYLRRGYRRSGVVFDYPTTADVGVPLDPELKIEILEKPVRGGHPPHFRGTHVNDAFDFVTRLNERQTGQLLAFYQGEWWTQGRSESELRRLLAGPGLNFAAITRENGDLAAYARAISDGVFKALIFDVIVAPNQRGAGLGTALMARVLADPVIAGVRHVELYCRPEMEGFYQRRGFTAEVGNLRFMRRSVQP